MKKALLIACASLLCLGSTAANAGGVFVGIGLPGPAYYAPPPPPVYYAPPPPPPVIYSQPAYYAPAPILVGPGWYSGRYYYRNHYYYPPHGGYHHGYHY